MTRIVDLNAREVHNDPTHCEVTATGFMGQTKMVLPLTLGQLYEGIMRWDSGVYIQRAFPSLDAGQREFLMTGMTPMQFDAACAEDEDEG